MGITEPREKPRKGWENEKVIPSVGGLRAEGRQGNSEGERKAIKQGYGK